VGFACGASENAALRISVAGNSGKFQEILLKEVLKEVLPELSPA
jgi:hypothetical protein